MAIIDSLVDQSDLPSSPRITDTAIDLVAGPPLGKNVSFSTLKCHWTENSMDAALQSMLDFVEGRMDVLTFEQILYSDTSWEALLKDESFKGHNTYIKTTPYDFLIGLNYKDPGDVLNAQGVLEFFLERKGVPFERTKIYSSFHDLLLSVQPKWLHLDPTYLTTQILPQAENRSGTALKEWLKERLKELFRFQKKPPKWIQNPAWPINEHGPLYFLGQVKIENCEYFHDEAAAYLFLDLKTGETKTVIQVF